MKTSEKIAKWASELIVLFLGVTLAFFVENYRQNKEEEEFLIRNLQRINRDLTNDSIDFAGNIIFCKRKIKRIDSLSALITASGKYRDKLLLISYLQNFYPINVFRTGFEEVKVSGMYSSIGNEKLSDSLAIYYDRIDLVKQEHAAFLEFLNGPLAQFITKNLHPDDDRFLGGILNEWPSHQRTYKSNLTAFDDISVLNMGKRAHHYYDYIAFYCESEILPANSQLRNKIVREIRR